MQDGVEQGSVFSIRVAEWRLDVSVTIPEFSIEQVGDRSIRNGKDHDVSVAAAVLWDLKEYGWLGFVFALEDSAPNSSSEIL